MSFIPFQTSNAILAGDFKSIPSWRQLSQEFGATKTVAEAKIEMLLHNYEMAAPTDEFFKLNVLAMLFREVDAWIAANAALKDQSRAKLMAELYKIVVAELCNFFLVSVNVLPEKLERLRGPEGETFVAMKGSFGEDDEYHMRNAVEREESRLQFEKGRAFRWKASARDWVPANTDDEDLKLVTSAAFTPDAYTCNAGFVMAMWDALYMAKHDAGVHRFHSQYMAGERVRCAGEMHILDGHVMAVSNLSGHYMPLPDHLLPVLWYLKQNGVSLLKTMVFARSGSELVQWEAEGFLRVAGNLDKGRRDRHVKEEWNLEPKVPRYGVPALKDLPPSLPTS